VVARGNHDQPKSGAAYAGCAPAGSTGLFDCLPAVYDLPRGRLTTTELHGLRLVGLDTTTLDTPSGAIDDAQFATLQDVLSRDPRQPTLVFGHHPVTDISANTTVAGPSFDLDRADAARLEALYARTPGVFFHHSGHTHRNLRTSAPAAPAVEFLEVAATKEYPGGFARLRVYAGGYMVSFFKSSSAGPPVEPDLQRGVPGPVPGLHAGHDRRPQSRGHQGLPRTAVNCASCHRTPGQTRVTCWP
jgi:3',5'-cyclic-AMP phosphodiesterase